MQSRIYDITGDEAVVSYQSMYDDIFIKKQKFDYSMMIRYLTQLDTEIRRILTSIKTPAIKDDSF